MRIRIHCSIGTYIERTHTFLATCVGDTSVYTHSAEISRQSVDVVRLGCHNRLTNIDLTKLVRTYRETTLDCDILIPQASTSKAISFFPLPTSLHGSVGWISTALKSGIFPPHKLSMHLSNLLLQPSIPPMLRKVDLGMFR